MQEHKRTPKRHLSQQVDVFYDTLNIIFKSDIYLRAYRFSSILKLLKTINRKSTIFPLIYEICFYFTFRDMWWRWQRWFFKRKTLSCSKNRWLSRNLKRKLIGPVSFESRIYATWYHQTIIKFIEQLDDEELRQERVKFTSLRSI